MVEKITFEVMLNYCNLIFKKVDNDIKEKACNLAFSKLLLDEPCYKRWGVSLNNPSNGFCILMLYRIARELSHLTSISEDELNRYYNYSKNNFFGVISPFASIEIGVIFNGVLFEIGKNTVIKENVLLNSNTYINAKCNAENVTSNILIDKNCVIGNNVVIFGKVNIGENVVISDNCFIRENIEANTKVEITNQLQLKHNYKSVLPSQNVLIYGITKKFKNIITIYGEGFYNPKIIIRDGLKREVFSEITYWDKNKILIKLKYAKYNEKEVKGAALVLMSNGHKITLLNNIALENLLKNLCE